MAEMMTEAARDKKIGELRLALHLNSDYIREFESKVATAVPSPHEIAEYDKAQRLSVYEHAQLTKSLHTRFIHSMPQTHCYYMLTCAVSVRMLCGSI